MEAFTEPKSSGVPGTTTRRQIRELVEAGWHGVAERIDIDEDGQVIGLV